MEPESSDIDPVDSEPSVESGDADNQGPIPLFADDAAMRIEAIKHAHGFNPNFDLVTRLRHIRYEIREWYGYDAMSATQKRAFAKKISKHATALLRLLQNAHDDELAHLAGENAARPYEKRPEPTPGALSEAELAPGAEMARISERLARLGPDLMWLADRATTANTHEAPRGRPHDHLLKNLVRGIRRVYVDAFGKEGARITRAGEFSGKFFDFVAAVLPFFGEAVPPNNTLGSLVADACAWVDEEPALTINPNN